MKRLTFYLAITVVFIFTADGISEKAISCTKKVIIYVKRLTKPIDYAEIYIQAGHEGRTKGATGASGPYGNEIDWTPVVADEATRILRKAGISVIRSKADHYRYSAVDLAVSIHFDGCAIYQKPK